MDVKEVGLHPENLAQNVVEWDLGPRLLHVEEGLAVHEFAVTDRTQSGPGKGFGETGHGVDEPADAAVVPRHDALAVPPGRMGALGQVVIVAEIARPRLVGVELAQPLVHLDRHESARVPGGALGPVREFQGDSTYRCIEEGHATAGISHLVEEKGYSRRVKFSDRTCYCCYYLLFRRIGINGVILYYSP